MAIREEDYGALYVSVDASSKDGQRRFLNATRLRLLGLVVAAIGGASTVTVDRVDLFGFAGMAAFVVALGAEVYIVRSRPERLWYEARAAAESAKTLAWRYMVGGDPFEVSVSRAEADQRLLSRLSEILQDLGDLDATPAITADRQITERMAAVRASDLQSRKEAYELDRVEDQRSWYASKSKWNGTQSQRLGLLAIVLELAGVIGATFKAFTIVDFDLLGPLAAAAAGLAAWSQAKQYQTLQRAYFVAGQELATIRSQIAAVSDETEWSEFVQNAEEAISREHTLWRASRGVLLRSTT